MNLKIQYKAIVQYESVLRQLQYFQTKNSLLYERVNVKGKRKLYNAHTHTHTDKLAFT